MDSSNLTVGDAALDLPVEMAELAELELVIERGLCAFVEAGSALLLIRDGEKYQASHYATFKDYCRGRWGLSVSYAQRLMAAAEVSALMEPIVSAMPPMGTVVQPSGILTTSGAIPMPTTERQVRPLRSLPGPSAQAEAWADAVAEAGGGMPTARQVEGVVKRRLEPEAEVDMPTIQELADQGMTHREIADRVGIHNSTVSRTLAGGGPRKLMSGYKAKLDRTTENAVGLAMAADQLTGEVGDATADQVAGWVRDLNRTIKSLNQLRNRIKENR